MLFLLYMVRLSQTLLCGGPACPPLHPEPPGLGRGHAAVQGDLSSSFIWRVNAPDAPGGSGYQPMGPTLLPYVLEETYAVELEQ